MDGKPRVGTDTAASLPRAKPKGPVPQEWQLHFTNRVSGYLDNSIPRAQNFPMSSSCAGSRFAILAIICTLAIFLFPAVRGPYAATHGPASSLEATTRAWIGFFLSLTALVLLSHSQLIFVSFIRLDKSDSLQSRVRERSSILRC